MLKYEVLPIILASTSPRRKELFSKLGLKFTAVESGYVEDLTLKLSPLVLVKHLSKGKALAVANKYPAHIIIGADTLVVCKGKILGKPKSKSLAHKMLKFISGQTVSVVTGLTVINTQTNKMITQAVAGKVQIAKLTRQQINNYILSGEPLDKAGAFAIQGLGAVIVKRISGDYHNIMGLPLYDLAQILKQFKIQVL